jgi:hypothetical protein
MDITTIRDIRQLTALETGDSSVLVPVADLRALLDDAELLARARDILAEREWNYATTNRRVREALGIPDPVSFRHDPVG